MKPKRLTESYPILGTIAWRDDELQLVLGIDIDYIYWRGSWGSGMDFGDRMNRGEDLDVIDAFPNYHRLESGAPRPNQNKVGSRLTVNAFEARVMGEYLFLQDAMLKRHAWYTMFSCNMKLDGFDINSRNWFVGFTPVVRFDNLDVIVDKEETDSRTWDRWGTTFGLIIDLLKHVKHKNEFTVNKEHTDGKNMVRNNEFLTQLEVKF